MVVMIWGTEPGRGMLDPIAAHLPYSAEYSSVLYSGELDLQIKCKITTLIPYDNPSVTCSPVFLMSSHQCPVNYLRSIMGNFVSGDPIQHTSLVQHYY